MEFTLKDLCREFHKYEIYVPNDQRDSLEGSVRWLIRDIVHGLIQNAELKRIHYYLLDEAEILTYSLTLISGKLNGAKFRLFVQPTDDQFIAIIRDGGRWNSATECFTLEDLKEKTSI